MSATGVHLHLYVQFFTDAFQADLDRTFVLGSIVLPMHINLLELTAVQNLLHIQHTVGWKIMSVWGQTTPTSKDRVRSRTAQDFGILPDFGKIIICTAWGLPNSLNTTVGRMSLGELINGVRSLPGHDCTNLVSEAHSTNVTLSMRFLYSRTSLVVKL